ncbi:MAG TPA: CPBP family intramembrane glutamic endopeptidase [Candidatus Dormibacteraeota bacterium]|nr:CPBP family intramembrane glutamic endopeptidase [Candidatus Dormibacteraeota bacterium]
MRPAAVSGWRLLLTLGLWAVLSAVAGAATLVSVRVVADTWLVHDRANLSAVLIAEVYLCLLVALLVAFGGPRGLRDRLGFRYTSAADIAVALLVWLAAVLVGALISAALVPLIGQPQSNAVSLLRQSFDPLFIAVIVPTVCLLAPVCEELLFRGALFGWLRRILPSPAAIALTAAIFAGAHLLPTLFPVLFVFGLGATWVRERTGSTLNSFAMHATQNTVAVLATYALLSQGA